MLKSVISIFTAIGLFFSSFGMLWQGNSSVKYLIDTGKLGSEIPNVVDNINIWEMGQTFYNPQKNEKYDIFNFVEYVQLMQCTGGNDTRDLFRNPSDRTVLDDYDFTKLIKNCRGILSLGAKPHLKLGSVPQKFTTSDKIGYFEVNLYPPDDYNQYYTYIKNVAKALVAEFGIDEVRTWRFGCMTEFENSDWFMAKSGDPKESEVAYCKLYDYTVQALIDVIGEDVFVGAHSMSVTEGLWKEENFIKHCAKGKNYATGETGTRLCFLSASFYDSAPGVYTKGYTLPKTIAHLKKCAEGYGLNSLIYGVDEGRILAGTKGRNDNQLLSRTTGYTYQGAYDARLFKQAVDSGADYFSSWDFLTGGLFDGYPTVSYHIANNIYKFAGSKKADVTASKVVVRAGVESDCLAGWNDETQTLRIMAYNFKNKVDFDKKMKVKVVATVPQFDTQSVTVTKYIVDDNCNFFDEWQKDRVKYGITDDCFNWSPDDGMIESTGVLDSEWAIGLYKEKLKAKYEECAQLIPVTQTIAVKDGKIELCDTLGGNNVVFYEITK